MRASAFLAVLLLATDLRAQTMPDDLFVNLGFGPMLASQTARAAAPVLDGIAVGMRLDRLFDTVGGSATRVRLNVGAHLWVARFERLDRDASGFRSWVGVIEGLDRSHVVFTERDGIVSGLINAVSATYQLRSVTPGVHMLEQVDRAALKRELEPLVRPMIGGASAAMPSAGEPDSSAVIDVGLLYTPAARLQAGGTAQIQAIATQVISDSNTIFARSGAATQFRLIGTTEFDFIETVDLQLDLERLINSPAARSLRDGARADVVQLLVSSPQSPSCGVGALLTSLASDFDAFSVADVACLAQYTPTHEMGHNMGSHHAPEDGAGGALFPYSYGFKDPARGFRTVMAYACVSTDCPRIANFSNPAVTHDGGATGSAAQNNALSISNAAATVANWRQGPPLMPPPAPTGLGSEVLGTFVTGFWDGPPPSVPVASYALQVGSVPGASNLLNGAVGNTTSVSGGVPAGHYFWRVIATNAAGSSPPSAEAELVVGPCVPPGPPRNFTFSVDGAVVTLDWLPAATGGPVAGYLIEAGSASGLANLYNGPTGRATPGGATAVPRGTYFVRLRAQNTCGISGPSNEQAIAVP